MATIARSERVERAERPARPTATGELDYRPSYVAAGVASLLVFALYLLTLSPSTAMWDASEYIASAYVLGIPHPPGNPFFVLIGHVFSHLPIAPTVAQRINVLAALCSAISAGMWFLITERVLVGWLPRRWQRIVGGSLAALIGATAFTVWNQSVVNEKVYTVSLAFFAIVAWLTVVWTDDPEGRRADRILILIAFLLGLGYSNHPAGLLVGPAVAFAVLARRWQTVLRWRLLLGALFAFALGLTPFIYQPIRAAQFPPINEGEPTACTTKLEAACTFTQVTKDRFMANVNREQYGKPELSDRQAPFPAQVGMWWLYFKWQWLRDAHDARPALQNVLAVLFLALGIMGGYVHWRRDRRSFWFFGPLMFTVTVALIVYMNFKYGYSQAPELGDSVPREVRDRDYFYLWSYSAWSVWAALGLVFVWETVAALIGADAVRVGRETVEEPRRTSWLAASPVLAFALLPLFFNWKQASRAGHTDTRDFAHDLLESVEPYGVIVTVGDNDTFPLWYAQEVEGIRKDVIVANTSLLNTDWYPRQLVRRPVYEYDAAKGPAIYRGQQWKKPSGPPVKLTMEQLDALPVYQELPQPQLFKTAGITATIDPRNLQNGVLEKADVFVLRMLLDAFPERPVYFSRTSGGYAQSLGLAPYLLTQGLARRVLPATPVNVGRDTVLVRGEGFVDLPRTHALWKDVFEAPGSIIRRGDWVDKPSVGIPFLYVTTGLVLADALNQTGQKQPADDVLRTAEQIAKATRLDDLFQQSRPREPLSFPGDSTAGAVIPVK
ncbi:MAG: DUF2723 domain-containing protein [Gemmatimonadaceae bacterium]